MYPGDGPIEGARGLTTVEIPVFLVNGENADDVRHRLACGDTREFVLRVALEGARRHFRNMIKAWETHQINMDQWAHTGPTTTELAAFREDIAWAFIVLPWMFYTICRRVEIGKPLTFAGFEGYNLDSDSVPGGRRVLFDTWITAILRDSNCPLPVGKFMAEARQQVFYGIPFSAGQMLSGCLEYVNPLVAQVEVLAKGTLEAYDPTLYKPI